MAGIYIHIPFCRKSCHYCNFHFTTSLRRKNELTGALLKEIELRADYLGGETIETVYFGGGTPSLLDPKELESILDRIHRNFKLAPGFELTLESNPDDINPETLDTWASLGINRLSLGIQSFFEEDLRWMNRAHSAEQAIQSLGLVMEKFPNSTADLIYGTPYLTNEKWRSNVERMLEFGVPHLSCYALTVEPDTLLHKQVKKGMSPDVDPDRQAEQFQWLMNWLEEAGFIHYEISNFAKPGFESRHNSSYWKRIKYLGIGPAAHSYDGKSRQWNPANNNKYIQALEKGIPEFEKEILTPVQQINEYIMTGLRTLQGINLDQIPSPHREEIMKESRHFIQKGQLLQKENTLILSKSGKLMADRIAAMLFREG